MKGVNRVCPICSYEEGEVLHTQRFNMPEKHVLPSSYDVVACGNCCFVYADTTASQKDYDLYYAELSKYEDTEVSSGGSAPWENERYERVVSDISPLLSKNSTILDIGCANGGLLSFLHEQGFSNLTGLDPSARCVEFVSKLGIRAILGGIFSNQLLTSQSKFDFVILSHVFEHLYDLRKAVQYISQYLNDDGYLYIEVPDASRYKDYYVVPFYYFDVEHINHFSKQSLNNLLLQFNLEYINSDQKEIQYHKLASILHYLDYTEKS